MSTCKGCGAPIRWALTPNGKRMPLDAARDDARQPGSYAIRGHTEPGPGETTYHAIPVAEAGETEAVHMNHWSTCPKRNQFKTGGPP